MLQIHHLNSSSAHVSIWVRCRPKRISLLSNHYVSREIFVRSEKQLELPTAEPDSNWHITRNVSKQLTLADVSVPLNLTRALYQCVVQFIAFSSLALFCGIWKIHSQINFYGALSKERYSSMIMKSRIVKFVCYRFNQPNARACYDVSSNFDVINWVHRNTFAKTGLLLSIGKAFEKSGRISADKEPTPQVDQFVAAVRSKVILSYHGAAILPGPIVNSGYSVFSQKFLAVLRQLYNLSQQ